MVRSARVASKIPYALGDELLIIQKELVEWDRTRERLGLLAINNGSLLVIENKLDDSSKDLERDEIEKKKSCLIYFSKPVEGHGDEEKWHEIIDWL